MQRRDLLRAFGAATALALVPHEAVAAWARVATGVRPVDGLTDAQLALVGAISDAIIPRTDTPGATDVGVPAFVNVIVSENYSDTDRVAFIDGLEALERAVKPVGSSSVDLEGIEAMSDRRTEPARTYWRLKGLIVHGFFTSEQISKQVLKVDIMPGKFDGAAPMPTRTPPSGAGHAHG